MLHDKSDIPGKKCFLDTYILILPEIKRLPTLPMLYVPRQMNAVFDDGLLDLIAVPDESGRCTRS